jgi:hypothetical protein
LLFDKFLEAHCRPLVSRLRAKDFRLITVAPPPLGAESHEFHSDINKAIAREKRIKKWARQWKLELIESFNPEWTDLYDVLNG